MKQLMLRISCVKSVLLFTTLMKLMSKAVTALCHFALVCRAMGADGHNILSETHFNCLGKQIACVVQRDNYCSHSQCLKTKLEDNSMSKEQV